MFWEMELNENVLPQIPLISITHFNDNWITLATVLTVNSIYGECVSDRVIDRYFFLQFFSVINTFDIVCILALSRFSFALSIRNKIYHNLFLFTKISDLVFYYYCEVTFMTTYFIEAKHRSICLHLMH